MIIEQIDRTGHILESKPFDSQSISLGRAYDNDVIVPDPYVDPHHAQLNFDCESGLFSICDLGTKNGLKTHGKKTLKFASGATHTFSSGKSFSLGKTRFRVLRADHPVDPAMSLSFIDNLHVVLGSWLVFIAASILTIVISGFLQAYLNKPYSNELYKDALNSVYLVIFAMAYGLIWSFVARSQRHDGHFLLHCNLILIVFVLLELFGLLHPFVAFNLKPILLDGFTINAFYGITIFLICYISFYHSTALGLYRRVGISLALPIVFWSSLAITALKEPDFRAIPPYDMTLIEPAFQLRSTISDDELQAQALGLYRPATEDAVERYQR
ncbi:MAG: hypothetical protein ACI9Y1_000503 [Lentisphaeria bacterium]|jgi:hypothetical protein